MESRTIHTATPDYGRDLSVNQTTHLSASAVSWGAIFAGASAAAALSLILLLLGTGLGLSAVSPWSNDGISGTTFGVTTIVWITLTSLVASAIGGYIAGRLRTRWLATHSDEVYFRDTAHGFLAWAIATLATATLLTSVISSIVSGAASAGATIAGGAVATATAATAATASANADEIKSASDKTVPYFLDFLFRKPAATPSTSVDPATGATVTNTGSTANAAQDSTSESTAEVSRIFMNAISTGNMPPADVKYAGQLVSERIGISQQDAENRVTDTFNLLKKKLQEAETAAREAADKARKATSYGSLWLFISLLIGAFVASFSATFGGRQRDL